MVSLIEKIKKMSFYQLKFSVKRKYSWKVKKIFYGSFGENSVFEIPLIIYNRKNIYIGKNVIIRPNLRIEPIRIYRDQVFDPKIIIGDGTTIEQNCHITCSNEIIIGKNVTISAYCYITDTDHDYTDISKGILEQDLIVKKTTIDDQSFIGIGSRILSGIRIGKHSIIGTNSVVTKDIPDFSVAVGNPAKIIKRYNFENQCWEKVKENR